MRKLSIVIFLYLFTFTFLTLVFRVDAYNNFWKDEIDTFIILPEMSVSEYSMYLNKVVTYDELSPTKKTRVNFLEATCLNSFYAVYHSHADKYYCSEYLKKVSVFDFYGRITLFDSTQFIETEDYKEAQSISYERKVLKEFQSKIAKLVIEMSTSKIPDNFNQSCKITDSDVGCSITFDKRDVTKLESIMNFSLTYPDYKVDCTDESELTKCFIDSSKQFMKVKEFLSKTKNIDPSLSNTQFMLMLKDSY